MADPIAATEPHWDGLVLRGLIGSDMMVRRQMQTRRQHPVTNKSKKSRRLQVLDLHESGTTMRVLAREELREIVGRLALGDRPGVAFEPVSTGR